MSTSEIETAVSKLSLIANKFKSSSDEGNEFNASTEINDDIKTINLVQQLLHDNLKIKDEEETWKDSGSFETIRASDGGPLKLIISSNEPIRVGTIMGRMAVTKATESSAVHSSPASEKKTSHECVHCSKTFTRSSTLSRHKKICSQKEELQAEIRVKKSPKFNCPMCDKEFGRKSTMARHVLQTHAQVKMFICRECNRAFASGENLARHEKSVHGNQGTQCSKCGKIISRLDNLKRHEDSVCEKRRRCSDSGENLSPPRLYDGSLTALSPLSCLNDFVFSPETEQIAQDFYNNLEARLDT